MSTFNEEVDCMLGLDFGVCDVQFCHVLFLIAGDPVFFEKVIAEVCDLFNILLTTGIDGNIG